MRMHPRRHGAYNFSARLASAIVNESEKNRKRNQKQQLKNISTNNSQLGCGCLAYGLFIGFILVVLAILNP